MSTTPCTLRQLRDVHAEVQDGIEVFSLDGAQLHTVKVVVTCKDEFTVASECIMALISDSTGEMGVFFYTDPESSDEDEQILERRKARSNMMTFAELGSKAPMVPNKYYVLHGRPRLMRKARGNPPTRIHLDVEHAELVATDFNLITAHNLECIYVHLRRTRGPPPLGGPTTPPSGGSDGFGDLGGEEDVW
jgi:hypothetical protein